ncbi:Oidioi.mRNA.OKI2018_I69.chr2.g6602.t1.cds [Oikopleura dioica]|uniref:E3 ubiquitin-protein ligase n=1 Tax=Oikopleura dioica TaxID=34765 RepID=A0ABN7TAG1_OIKDI|nr:Oidioi.mRNA.OKI2018_I69.chr2.g6602.t1.cds [Oikopleura dioica]
MGLEGTPSLSDRKLTVTGSSGNDRDSAFQRDSQNESMPNQNSATIGKSGPFGQSANPARASQRAVPMHVDVIKSEADMPNSNNSELAALFECPVCYDYVLPPIHQCSIGHLICGQCRPKLQTCPTCRGQIPQIRNLAMEKVAATVYFPCKYKQNGCNQQMLHTEKPTHEDQCEFRPYVCPCPGASCKWSGNLDEVMEHLLVNHKSITTLQGEDIVFLATDVNLPGAVDWVMMQSCFNNHFMLVLEKQEKFDGHVQFFAVVQLIGTRKQAQQFAYRLELNGHRRRLTWEATPRSIHEGVSSAIQNSDCLVFDTAVAQMFSENGNLGINVTISLTSMST